VLEFFHVIETNPLVVNTWIMSNSVLFSIRVILLAL